MLLLNFFLFFLYHYDIASQSYMKDSKGNSYQMYNPIFKNKQPQIRMEFNKYFHICGKCDKWVQN